MSGGIYNVTVTDANGCTITATADITEPAALVISVDPPVDVECNGGMTGAIDIEVTGGTPVYTFNWGGPGGPYTTEDLSGLGAGTYTVTVTDDNGCEAIEIVSVNEASNLLLTMNTPDPLACNGDIDGAINIDVSGGMPGYTYNWDGPGGPYTTEDISGLGAGTYSVTVTDDSGCSVFGTEIIAEPTALTASVVGDIILCAGDGDGDVDLTVTDGTPPYTFDWDNDGTGDNDDTEDLSGLSGGTYNVTVTDANGCTITATADITEPAALVISVDPPVDVECNGGMTGAIDIEVTGGTPVYTFNWGGPGGPYTTEDLSGLGAGTYTVTVTDDNGCEAIEIVSVNEASNLLLTMNTPDPLACNGDIDGAINIDVSGGMPGYTYNWDGPGGPYTTEDISGLGAGTYSVTVTDDSGCSVFGTETIIEPTALTSSVIGTDVTCFGGDNGAIDLTVSDGTPPYSFDWDNAPNMEDVSGLTAGTYNVTITDDNGCTTTDGVTINEPTELTSLVSDGVTSCAGISDGILDLTVSGSVPPYTYDWDNDGTGDNDDAEDPTGLAAGTYTVIVTDGNGCTTTASGVIVDAVSVTASATVDDEASCSGSNDGIATASGMGGTGTYTYEWSNGETTQTATGLDVGINVVTVTDGNGCQGTASVNISSTVIVAGNGVVSNVSCEGGSDGQIELFPSGGDIPYTIVWSTGSGANPLTGLSMGQYQVTITDNNGCNTVETYDITEPSVIVIGGTGGNLQCTGDNSGSISLTVSGGTPTYNYTWSHDATLNLPNASGLPAGIYTVTVTDANGCTAIESITIDEPALLTGTANILSEPLCTGDANGVVEVVVTGGSGAYTYLWSNGDTANPTLSCPAGLGSVTVTDGNGCVFVEVFTLGEPDLLIANADNGETSCTGLNDGSITSTVSGGTPGYTYNWNGPGGPYTTSDLTGLPAGTFNLTVTDTNGCQAFTSAIVTEATSVVATAVVDQDPSCLGSFDGAASVTGIGGTGTYTYEWSTNPVQTTQTAINLDPITYTVTITDGNGCQGTASVTLNSTVNVQPNGTSTDVSCNGGNDGTITLSPTGGGTPYTFVWDNGLAPINPQTTLVAGTYTVTVFDANGCGTAETYTINEPASPLNINIVNIEEASCIPGNDGAIEIAVTGGTQPYTYTWTPVGGNSPTINNLPSGTYTVTVTDANGCQEFQSVNVPNPSGLVATTTFIADVLCFGDSNGSASAGQTGGNAPYTYLWSSGEVTMVATNLPTGTNTVTVTDIDGCSDIASVNIGTPDLLEANANGTNPSCTGDTDGTLSATATGGTSPYTYNWGSIGTGSTINNVGAGTYIVTIVDANGCIATSTTTLIDPVPVTVNVSSPQGVSCSGGNDGQALAIAGGGTAPYTYLWDNGESVNPAILLNAGTHIVTVTDVNGCTETSSVFIDQPTPVLPQGIVSTPISCFDGSDGSVTAGATGGTPPYTFEWNTTPVQTGSTITGLSAGTYTVLITDANGCSLAPVNVTVVEPDTPVSLSLSSTDALCNGSSDGSVSVSATGGTPSYTYNWSTGATVQNVAELPAGTYTVTVTDANNCSAVENVNVGEPTAITAALNVQNVTCFGDTDGSISIDTTYGGSEPYVYALDNDDFSTTTTFNGLLSGNYEVFVQDANGCETSYTATVIEPFELEVDMGVDITVLLGQEAELYAVPNTAAPLTYIWTPSEGLSCGMDTLTACDNPVFTPFENTTYTVTIVDSLGCSATDEILVQVDKRYDIYIPNAFSPDFDGVNDVFMIYGGQMVQQVNSFRVYDRWGELVWEASDFQTDDSNYGWNGSFRDKRMNPGVFVYYAEVEFIDGQVITYKGDVTLVK